MNFRDWRAKNWYLTARIHKHNTCSNCRFRRGLNFMECVLAENECNGDNRTRRVGKKSRCIRWEEKTVP